MTKRDWMIGVAAFFLGSVAFAQGCDEPNVVQVKPCQPTEAVCECHVSVEPCPPCQDCSLLEPPFAPPCECPPEGIRLETLRKLCPEYLKCPKSDCKTRIEVGSLELGRPHWTRGFNGTILGGEDTIGGFIDHDRASWVWFGRRFTPSVGYLRMRQDFPEYFSDKLDSHRNLIVGAIRIE